MMPVANPPGISFAGGACNSGLTMNCRVMKPAYFGAVKQAGGMKHVGVQMKLVGFL